MARHKKKNKKKPSLGPCINTLEQGFYDYLKRNVKEIYYEKDTLPYILPKRYIPDFKVVTKSGKEIYIEVKGYLRPEDRTKMKAVKLANPNVDLRLVFARDNKLRKNSKTTYSQWAEKNGFMWAVEKIPKEWIQ